MAVIALTAPKGSPGVSATALALGLTWSPRALVAECDPAGGDAMSGYLRGELDFPGGLASLPALHGRGRLESELWQNMIDLVPPHNDRLLLPGVRHAASSGGVAAIGDTLARLFADLGRAQRSYDVIADCGRLAATNTPWPVLGSADVVGLVVRGTLPSLTHAQAAIYVLKERFAREGWDTGRIGLIVIGEGPYAQEAARRLEIAELARLPFDPATAAKLTAGAGTPKAKDKLIAAVRDVLQPALRTAISRSGALEVAHV